MKNPPFWKHLRDIYSFKDAQPHSLSSKRVKGISQPNNVRIFWGSGGNLLVQSKHWLTSESWGEALVLLDQTEVIQVGQLFPGIVEPAWDESFLTKSEAFFQKLEDLFLGLRSEKLSVGIVTFVTVLGPPSESQGCVQLRFRRLVSRSAGPC